MDSRWWQQLSYRMWASYASWWKIIVDEAKPHRSSMHVSSVSCAKDLDPASLSFLILRSNSSFWTYRFNLLILLRMRPLRVERWVPTSRPRSWRDKTSGIGSVWHRERYYGAYRTKRKQPGKRSMRALPHVPHHRWARGMCLQTRGRVRFAAFAECWLCCLCQHTIMSPQLS